MKRYFGIIVVAVLACCATTAFGGVDIVSSPSGEWTTSSIGANLNGYAHLATDRILTKWFYGAGEDGGLDIIYYDTEGGHWSTSSTVLAGNKYVWIAADGQTDRWLCGARADTGVDFLYWTVGEWRNYNFPGTSAHKYTCTATDNWSTKVYFAARATTGIDMIYNEVGDWRLYTFPGTDDHTYNSITTDAQNDPEDRLAKRVFGARSTGGVDLIYQKVISPGVRNWQYAPLPGNTTIYSQIVADGVNGLMVYGAKPGGGVDIVAKNETSGDWYTTPIPGNNNVYVSLTAERVNGKVIYAARATGGIDMIYYSSESSAWLTEAIPDNTTRYGSIAADCLSAKTVYGSLPRVTATIADAKKLVDGTPVECPVQNEMTVTASFSIPGNDEDVWTFFYMENNDRSSGLRVETDGYTSTVGKKVSVNGAMGTLQSGERYIRASSVTETDGTPLTPLMMVNRSLGGSAFGNPPTGQSGVFSGVGLNNIGLLVRVVGKITSVIDGQNYVIDDGSGVTLQVYDPSPSAPWPNDVGTYVAVNGVSSCQLNPSDSSIMRLLISTGGFTPVN